MLMIDCGIAIKWDVTDAVRRVRAMEEYELDVGRGAARCLGSRGLRESAREDHDADRLRREGMDARRLRAGARDRNGRRRRDRPGRAEGITGFKKACDRIEAYRRQANAHAWSSAIVTAASFAISFSSPACKLFELKPLRNPMQHDLVPGAVRARRRMGLSAERTGARDRGDREVVVRRFAE